MTGTPAVLDESRCTSDGDGSASLRGRVVLAGVTKRFGAVTAVDDVDLDIAAGEFLVLLGPSGCGKSTILRLIAGLEEPSEGTIAIDDDIVNDVDPRDRDVAMVFQTYALYPHMTVAKNMEFPLRSRHVDRQERERVVAEVAHTLDLDGLLDRKPAALSGGQRQRVALARAIVRRPLVFLMDEPLSNLDAMLRVQTRAELVDLHRTLGTTVVYVTHDQVEAMTMGDRIAVISDGKVQQTGPPQEVYDRPANVFVAKFIGSPPMNTLLGVVETEDGVTAVVLPGGRVRVPEPLARGLIELDLATALVGVRPEHLILSENGPVHASVLLVESLGHELLVACRVNDATIVIVRLDAASDVPHPGEAVRLACSPDHLHVFDPTTGLRIEPKGE